jgi:hypothetical protein
VRSGQSDLAADDAQLFTRARLVLAQRLDADDLLDDAASACGTTGESL